MNFTKLSITNFLTIGTGEVELNERGLLLIQGENKEDSSANSNGAGKSSVVDALCWCLFGVTARGVTGDSVVNRKAKKDCRVSVEFVDGTDQYAVVRHRKDSKEKNQVLVYRMGATPVDMSKGTDKETQEVINGLLGCSLEVFMAAVYSGQEMMPDLPGMTDKMLKTLIEEAAGVEVLTQAYSVARNAHATAKTEATIHSADLQRKQEDVENIALELARLNLAQNDFEAGRRERAKEELSKSLKSKAAIAEYQAKAAAFDRAALELESAELVKSLVGRRDQEKEAARLRTLVSQAWRAKTDADSSLGRAIVEVTSAEMNLKKVDSQVGQPCSECGKPYHGEDLASVREIRVNALNERKSKIEPLKLLLKRAQDAENKAIVEATAYEATMTDVTEVAVRQAVVSDHLSTLSSYETTIKTFEFEVTRQTDAAKVKLTEVNPHAGMVVAKTEELSKRKEEVAAAQLKLDKLTAKADLLADAVAVFGPAGVRAHILDTVTPFLNERTREYLGALADGNIHAVWSTLSKTSKGELKEKFNIEVTNDKGADSFAGLSGGEKRKVRLATSMAMQDLVASRATKPIGLYVGDEIDDALDDAGLERLMTMLERKARERGTVLVISHNSLADWVTNVITVTKEEGYSKLSGENLRS